ncbi:hypothetical protein SAMN05660831_00652 [Thiohalospira halophila DSM 15071]|uniref:DUF4412 domain-containing protein n=1 Tax=Thiohalospira halophila DSM 15071 TaxID=1123397 RepID=A0A1I1P7D6_9GAMM|nr:hypothetical protein [Thiohalospira halophila]SFD05871.1 hypothetical protein SAMN05660831_00652 [Thiohalospira halophila DSM 15071]
MRTIALTTLAAATFLLAGCGESGSGKEEKSETTATVVEFTESEQGRAPYSSRAIVTDRWLRIDFGEGASDYMLLDRADETVYNIVPRDQTILVIESGEVPDEPPRDLELAASDEAMGEDAPTLEGRKARHHEFSAGGETCYQTLVVPGLLPDVRAAMGEFLAVMAGEHARVLDRMPAENRTACDLADDIFATGRQWEAGMPVMEWHPDGTRRELVDYERDKAVEPELFRIPEGFERYSPSDVGSLTPEG